MTEMNELASDFDFQASSRAAEEAALAAEGGEAPAEPEDTGGYVETQTALPTEPEAESEGRARGPDGRFLPKEQPAEESAEEFYAGRYRTREEAERGIAEAQAAAQRAQAERDQERQRAYEYEQMLRQQQQALQQPGLPPNFVDIIDDNPAGAAQMAYRARDQYAFQQAADAWEEMAPGAPALFLQNMQLAERLNQIEQRTQQQMAPALEQHAEQQRVQRLRQFDAENPWFKDIPNDEVIAVIEANPNLHAALISPDVEEFTRGLFVAGYEALQRRAAQNGQIQSAVQDVARTQATEAQRAREDAFVASSQTATAQEPVTFEEREKALMEDRVRARQDKWDSGLVYGAPRT